MLSINESNTVAKVCVGAFVFLKLDTLMSWLTSYSIKSNVTLHTYYSVLKGKFQIYAMKL